jgi:hypothetical protein
MKLTVAWLNAWSDCLNQLAQLASLADDWDGLGADPPTLQTDDRVARREMFKSPDRFGWWLYTRLRLYKP